ncbi:DUF7848 domain-containing protein [Streptacidiphilus sp. PAMC 29251]
MSRRRFRFVQMKLTPDPHSGPPTYETQCTVCGELSGEADDPEAPELWCLHHAGRTHHFGFKSVLSTLLLVTPLEEIQ